MASGDSVQNNSTIYQTLSTSKTSLFHQESLELAPQWKYTMRRSMQEVVPGVFLGPYSLVQKSKLYYLKKQGITHIICVRQDVEARFIKPNFPEEIQYLTLNIADSPEENIKQYFDIVRTFIDLSLGQGGKVLIHGNTGQSRSATLAVAYIMRKFGVGVEEALKLVQRRRFCVCPNPGFLAQLEEYGKDLSLPQEEYSEHSPPKRLRLSSDS